METKPLQPEVSPEGAKAIQREAAWCAVVMTSAVLYANEFQSMFRYLHRSGFALHLALNFAAIGLMYWFVEVRVLRYLLVPKRAIWGIAVSMPLLGVLTSLLLVFIGSFVMRFVPSALSEIMRLEWIDSPYGESQAHRWVLTITAVQVLFALVHVIARRRLKPWQLDNREAARPA